MRRPPSAWRLTVAVAAAALLQVAPAAAAVPDDATWFEEYFPSRDGTQLHADVFRPKELPRDARTPVILLVGPYFGLTADPLEPNVLPYYQDLFAVAFERGYSIVQVTLRGFGASRGCRDFAGPGEQADAHAAVEWAASRPWSTGAVGMWGLSYDANTAVMAMASEARGLRAAVVMGTPVSAYRALHLNRVRYAPFSYAFHPYYELFGLPPLTAFAPGQPANAAIRQAENPGCPLTKAPSANPEPAAAWWRERDLVPRARHSRVPVLWSHGLFDANAKPDHLTALYPLLRGPKRAWFAQHYHVVPGEAEMGRPELIGRKGWTEEAMRWLDRWVKGVPPSRAPVETDPPVVAQQGPDGRWRYELDWPPRDARPHRLPLLDGSYRDTGGNKGEPYCTHTEPPDPSCVPGDTGVGAWTLTPPLPHDVHLAGEPGFAARVDPGSPRSNVIVLLYDVDEEHRAKLITRGASVADGAGEVRFSLYPQDWRIAKGHRIGVLVTGADDGWFEPKTTGATTTFTDAALELPLLRYERLGFLSGGPSRALVDRTTFTLEDAVLAARERRSRPPARLLVRPRRLVLRVAAPALHARRTGRLRVTTLAREYGAMRRLPRVAVRVGPVRTRTNLRGVAVVRRRFARGRLRIAARRPGFVGDRVSMRVR